MWVSEWLYDMVVSEWLYEMVDVRSHSRNISSEISPNVRVSERLYEMVAVPSQWWMCGGFPQCTEVSRVRAMEISKVKKERKADV